MKNQLTPKWKIRPRGPAVFLALIFVLFFAVHAQAAAEITVHVVDQDGTPVPGFRWLLEDDNTHDPAPGFHRPVDLGDVNNNTLSLSLHMSHAPVVASGEEETDTAVITQAASGALLEDGRYFVSVHPWGNAADCGTTYDMGGTTVDTTEQTEVTVFVRQNPIETAQISVKVFHDILPLNNAPDITEIDPENSTHPWLETVEGFTVTITDQGGDIVQDAFGNKLGTTYQTDGDGQFVLDPATCQPIVDVVGPGDYITPPNGEVLIKNLAPGKYGIQVEPPDGTSWYQVTTIEGTQTIDAWVRPNEPPFLVEFGPPAWHVFYGFVKPFNRLNEITAPGEALNDITGSIRKGHLTRPPSITFFDGPPPEGEAVGERCLVGLNGLEAGFTETFWMGACEDETGNFTIPAVPPGTYQLVMWDVTLLQIISFNTVVVPDTPGVIDLGTIAVPMWFGQHEHWVFADGNKNATREPGEPGVPEQNINLRFRDGTIYQAFPTDTEGFVPFQAIFPFFHWLTAEVDFARLQATGVSVVVDEGGPVDNGPLGEGKRTPQPGSPRIEQGPALVEAFQQFAGQNTRYEWGKAPYDLDVNAVDNASEAAYFASLENWPDGAGDIDDCTPGAPGCSAAGDGEFQANGGISGIVYYAVTRAEDDPRLAAAEPWEPGVPRVQVNLYRDVWCQSNGLPAVYPVCPEATPGEVGDGKPDDRNANGLVDLADVDNHPLGWAEGGLKGPEDVDRNGNDIFDLGDAIRTAWTDSWDDNLPEGCYGPAGDELAIHGTPVPFEQCAEGLRTWNQSRPGVFDGGFAFGPGDPLLVAGTYIVEAATPPGYELLKEEDRNVDFGPTPIPAILPPKCVGDPHEVPPLLSFLTRDNGDPLPGIDPGNPDFAAPFTGDVRPLCDRKKVDLGGSQNAAAEFFLYTDVPKAARGVGLITDDLANELAPGKPAFTEKFSPPWISLAVFDYTGKEIFRTYGDEFGAYNFMAPASYAVNLPTPSGVSPKMNQFCLNHPGPIPDPDNPGEFIIDPRFRPQYSTTCYTFNFESGRVTYLDTPVIRQAAFVGALQSTLDCELPHNTPGIASVRNRSTGDWGPLVRAGERLEIRSLPRQLVPNPAFPGDADNDGIADDPPTEPEFIYRDYTFGNREGTVCVGDTFCFDPRDVVWRTSRIDIRVPDPLPAGLASGQLTITRLDGASTRVGITLTVADGPGGVGGNVIHVACDPGVDGLCTGSIQDAIDAAADGDLILVAPGIYPQLPILYKRVKLQGSGAGGTTIFANHTSGGSAFSNPLDVWRQTLVALDGAGQIGRLPEQALIDPMTLFLDGEGAGITVAPLAGRFAAGGGGRDDLSRRARIDGFTVTRGDIGGAVYVNGYADRLLVSNNRLTANAGNLGGGIRVGNGAVAQLLPGTINQPVEPVADSFNPEIDIRHNQIDHNGSQRMAGGIGLYNGADSYRVEDNFLCGNFARSGGGGIAHRGLTETVPGQDDPLIADNWIVFNEVFQGNQPGTGLGVGGGGGGIEVAGNPDTEGGGLTQGTGSVDIVRNLIQGNLGGAADGGGIALRNVNGDDVAAAPGDPSTWHAVRIYNNMIVNNVSGLGGAGIALQDALMVDIAYNTVAHNDSAAVSAFAFEGGQANPSTPQVAGIVSRANSVGLQDVLPGGAAAFSEPERLSHNIVWENRSFYWDGSAMPYLRPNLPGPPYEGFWDLGVSGVDGGACLEPEWSALSFTEDPAGCTYDGNNIFPVGDPFVDPYRNDLVSAAAADEGGNFVQLYYSPLGVTGDYHLAPGAAPIDSVDTAAGLPGDDFDGDSRPQGVRLDRGADEFESAAVPASAAGRLNDRRRPARR